MRKCHLMVACVACFILAGCATVRQDEVGFRRTFGRLKERPLESGLHMVNPLTSRIIRIPARSISMTVFADLPTKEGLTVKAEIALLYHIERERMPIILRELGIRYQDNFIAPAFRSVIRDVSARFYAKDLHTAERAVIERTIAEDLSRIVSKRGFVVEAILMKSIQLPERLVEAIELKLQAEQDAQRMQFVLERQKLEAQRRIIEAQGEQEAQQILSKTLTPLLIQYHYIQALRELAASGNSKVIVLDSKNPYLLPLEYKSNP